MNPAIYVGIVVIIIVIGYSLCNRPTENYKPFINPVLTTVPAPWIPQKTPIPKATELSITEGTAQILSHSVDPGAHLECQSWCEKKGGQDVNKEFMQVCIDTCMQEKWRNPDSKLTEFRP